MKSLFDAIEKAIDYIEITLLFMITGVIGAQVFSRTIFDKPLTFPEEVSMFGLIAIVLLGMFVVEKDGYHIRVGFFFDKMPQFAKQIVFISGKVLTSVIVMWILLGEKELFPGIIPLKTTAGSIPYLWLHTIIVVACFLWLVVLIYDIIRFFVTKERQSCF